MNTQRHEEGQGLLEYGLLIVLVAILLVVLVSLLGDEIRQVYTDIWNALKNVFSSSGQEMILNLI